MSFFKKTVNNRSFTIFLHAIMWLCYFFLPILIMGERERRAGEHLNPYQKEIYPIYFIYFVNIVSIVLFYFNSELLIPKILKKRGISFYIISVIATFGAIYFIDALLKKIILDLPNARVFSFNLITLFFIFAISTCYRLLYDFQSEQETQKEKENERLKSELSFLRSQISPHFMFNLLNSLVSLARKKSDILEPVLIKMSDLLRYMLYDSDDKQISLENEVRYLNSYIDLQKLRFGNYIKTNFIVENLEITQKIEPMLLIPFVENAFKHGVGMKDPVIDIYMNSTEKHLFFSVSNKVAHEHKGHKDGSSGIGLTNVKRRLALLYPERHELSIQEKNDWFICELTLNVKPLITNDYHSFTQKLQVEKV